MTGALGAGLLSGRCPRGCPGTHGPSQNRPGPRASCGDIRFALPACMRRGTPEPCAVRPLRVTRTEISGMSFLGMCFSSRPPLAPPARARAQRDFSLGCTAKGAAELICAGKMSRPVCLLCSQSHLPEQCYYCFRSHLATMAPATSPRSHVRIDARGRQQQVWILQCSRGDVLCMARGQNAVRTQPTATTLRRVWAARLTCSPKLSLYCPHQIESALAKVCGSPRPL